MLPTAKVVSTAARPEPPGVSQALRRRSSGTWMKAPCSGTPIVALGCVLEASTLLDMRLRKAWNVTGGAFVLEVPLAWSWGLVEEEAEGDVDEDDELLRGTSHSHPRTAA